MNKRMQTQMHNIYIYTIYTHSKIYAVHVDFQCAVPTPSLQQRDFRSILTQQHAAKLLWVIMLARRNHHIRKIRDSPSDLCMCDMCDPANRNSKTHSSNSSNPNSSHWDTFLHHSTAPQMRVKNKVEEYCIEL